MREKHWAVLTAGKIAAVPEDQDIPSPTDKLRMESGLTFCSLLPIMDTRDMVRMRYYICRAIHCTVIRVQMGEKAFGCAASQAELWLTLRAEHDEDLAALQAGILKAAQALARAFCLGVSHQTQDDSRH